MRCSPSSRTSTTKLTNLPRRRRRTCHPWTKPSRFVRKPGPRAIWPGAKNAGNEIADGKLTAKLLTALDDLTAKTTDAVDAASLAVAEVLISTVIAVASDDWPAKLLGRVRMIADRVKPALTVAPEFVLRDDGGTERRFADIDSLSRALDEGVVGEDVTIKWHRGEATISREALLEDLREAVIPLSAGLVNEQVPRHPS